MHKPIYITSISSISALGNTTEQVWKNYKSAAHFISEKNGHLVSELSGDSQAEILKLKSLDSKYKALDDSVLFGIYSARKATKKAGWSSEGNFGINIGSSRGATQLFESYHEDFLKNNKAKTLSSPTTTLGNISSWIAHDLQTQGPEISHSITCSTALHAILNGVAWLQSGLCNKFLVGGSEAPLTPFTISQMQALKIYAKQSGQSEDSYYPCRALDLNKKQNTMVLGEGAAMACLESQETPNALAKITGMGYATEILEHNVSLSANGDCFIKSMNMALGDLNPKDIDVIVTHTPGTIKGDTSEFHAIKKVFCNSTPSLTTNKWKLGHTLGASGMLSVEMAVLMLQNQEFISVPYIETQQPKRLKNILVNAVGFGGNAVSILLSK
ncbi:beta-ketoacyl synthase N-terminal-like domain-containing protein [Lacinutrix neustonica]|uniref:Beta-ketoacyl synthase N-terminal-like domain-containing protein n=1 Tax=Lacinutrix neustonica TaxID=2980107 RepID=A0A9E8MSX4_9FLAO|nr:beta-ketoacyl synthase N-terminal-like domain-containing protein [Lacinutrix neustonica]WAC00853.1 beta-ketoacyl synthase N-terminal-like domain-containing protein [Lacinutrix neustonica]